MAAKLTDPQIRYVVKQLSLGATKAVIQEQFQKEFGRGISVITIGRIRKTNTQAITESRALIAADGAVSAAVLKQKAHQLMESRLDEAIEDASELKKIRKQLQAGEINEVQYKNKVALYRELTINELTKVSEAMHSQTKGEKDDPVTPQDQAALAALLAGIQSGNPVQLIQVLTRRGAGIQVA